MENTDLAELQIKAFEIIDKKKVPENELKYFIALIMELLTKQFFQHKANNELLEEILNNISLNQIVKNEE